MTVSFLGQKPSTTAGTDGKWKVYLKPLPAGGPYKMTVSGQNTIELKDILVGEVWIGSGQSNMGVTVARAKNPEQEIANANYNQVRLFKVKLTVAGAAGRGRRGKLAVLQSGSGEELLGHRLFLFARHSPGAQVPGRVHRNGLGRHARRSLDQPSGARSRAGAEKRLLGMGRSPGEISRREGAVRQAARSVDGGGQARCKPSERACGTGPSVHAAGLYNAMIAPHHSARDARRALVSGRAQRE